MVGNDKGMSILNIGNIFIPFASKISHLKHMLYTLAISKKFINVNRCCTDNNAFIEFQPTFFLVKDQLSKKVLMQGHLEQGFYKLSNSLSHYNSFEAQASSNVSPPTNVFLCENKSFKL